MKNKLCFLSIVLTCLFFTACSSKTEFYQPPFDVTSPAEKIYAASVPILKDLVEKQSKYYAKNNVYAKDFSELGVTFKDIASSETDEAGDKEICVKSNYCYSLLGNTISVYFFNETLVLHDMSALKEILDQRMKQQYYIVVSLQEGGYKASCISTLEPANNTCESLGGKDPDNDPENELFSQWTTYALPANFLETFK